VTAFRRALLCLWIMVVALLNPIWLPAMIIGCVGTFIAKNDFLLFGDWLFSGFVFVGDKILGD